MSEITKYILFNLKETNLLNAENLGEELINVILPTLESYPLTYLEKENLRKQIDNLKFFFWIKNRRGICELANQNLAEFYEQMLPHLEGNEESLLYDNETKRIIKSISEVINTTKNCLYAEQIRFSNKSQKIFLNLLCIPVINDEATVIATICMAGKNEFVKIKSSENSTSPELSIYNLPYASALINTKGFLIDANSEFELLLGGKIKEVKNSSIINTFFPSFTDAFNKFIASDDEKIRVKRGDLLINNEKKLQLELGKIFDKNGEIQSVLCILNEIETINNNLFENKNFTIMQSFLKNNPDAVIICDKETLKFIDVNEAAQNLYGYNKEEMLQMDFTDLYFTEDIQLLLDSSIANLKEGIFYGPVKHKKKDGSVVFVELSKYTTTYQNNEVYFNIVRNVSKKLEEEKKIQSFKSVFENSDDLIFITDSSGFIQFTNDKVIKHLGLTKNELLNSSFISLASDDERGRIGKEIFHSKEQKTKTVLVNLKSVNGEYLPVNITAVPILDLNKEIYAFTIICKPNSSVLHAEESENHKGSDFTQRRLSNIDSNFLSKLFHDLLTPINVIIGYTQELTESTAKPSKEQKEASQIIKQNRDNLLQSMNAAIEYASLFESKVDLNITEVKIVDIIEQLINETEELKSLTGVEFAYGKISSSLKFQSDSDRFKSLLSLLFKIITRLSDKKRFHFSAFSNDENTFLITFRDLQTQSSKQLVTNLKDLFEGKLLDEKFGLSGVITKLAQLMLKLLQGRFEVIASEKETMDYGFIFPLKLKVSETYTDNIVDGEVLSSKESTEKSTIDNFKVETPKLTQKGAKNIDSKLKNELRIEMLREEIRKKEAEKKHTKRNEEETSVNEDDQELVSDTIEYIDVNLKGDEEDQAEDEIIEIIESPKIKNSRDEKPKPIPSDEKVDISNLSCLYFEDQVDAQILFRLQMKGLKKLDFAVSFEESLPLLESGEYDFIVVDINLQGSYNGLDILKILRTMPKYENTPVFAVTAYVLPGDQQKFVVAGFSGFISKPIFRDDMIDVLAEVFNQQKQS